MALHDGLHLEGGCHGGLDLWRLLRERGTGSELHQLIGKRMEGDHVFFVVTPETLGVTVLAEFRGWGVVRCTGKVVTPETLGTWVLAELRSMGAACCTGNVVAPEMLGDTDLVVSIVGPATSRSTRGTICVGEVRIPKTESCGVGMLSEMERAPVKARVMVSVNAVIASAIALKAPRMRLTVSVGEAMLSEIASVVWCAF